MKRILRRTAMVAVSLLLASSPALAASRECAVSGVHVIEREDGEARVLFRLAAAGGARAVRVRIYDVQGRLVATVLDEAEVLAGQRAFSWNRRDRAGTPVASGVYFVRLDTSVESATAKLVVIR